MFTLQILRKIEAMVCTRTNNPSARLSDYFDLIGGTSTGSIIASGLALGWSVQELEDLYRELGDVIFQKNILRKGFFRAKYPAEPLKKALKKSFGERTLESEDLLTGLAIIAKRLDTGSPWVLTNNPQARYYYNHNPKSDAFPNKDYLLRQVIRASTAAPHFFDPEAIPISPGVEGAFVDGGVSPHNNPALQLFLLATLDGYNIRWPIGPDNLLLVSVGTGFKALKLTKDQVVSMGSAESAGRSLLSLMDDASHLNELLLQMFSQTSPTARELDREVKKGTAKESGIQPWISYLRYDAALEKDWIKENLNIDAPERQIADLLAMDNPTMLDTFARLGNKTAEAMFDEAHFPSQFDIKPMNP